MSLYFYLCKSIVYCMNIVNRLWHFIIHFTIKKRLHFFGKGLHLHGNITITHPEYVRIGNNVHIGTNAYINSRGGLDIGDNTHISRNLVLYTSSHNYEGDCIPYDNTRILKKVTIEKNVWIGMNVKIIPGVTIGEGAIVGLGTVVTNDVPPLAIIGSEKHRILKYRDKKRYEYLEYNKLYGGVNGNKL